MALLKSHYMPQYPSLLPCQPCPLISEKTAPLSTDQSLRRNRGVSSIQSQVWIQPGLPGGRNPCAGGRTLEQRRAALEGSARAAPRVWGRQDLTQDGLVRRGPRRGRTQATRGDLGEGGPFTGQIGPDPAKRWILPTVLLLITFFKQDKVTLYFRHICCEVKS